MSRLHLLIVAIAVAVLSTLAVVGAASAATVSQELYDGHLARPDLTVPDVDTLVKAAGGQTDYQGSGRAGLSASGFLVYDTEGELAWELGGRRLSFANPTYNLFTGEVSAKVNGSTAATTVLTLDKSKVAILWASCSIILDCDIYPYIGNMFASLSPVGAYIFNGFFGTTTFKSGTFLGRTDVFF